MSAVARVRPAGTPTTSPAPVRTPLRLVPQRLVPQRLVVQRRSRARRAPFVAVVVSLLAAGLLCLLALNTVLAQDAFRLHELQVQGRQLADREQALLTSVEELQAPRAIAERAQGLGMVPGGPPAFLRLPDGAVLGAGGPAAAATPAPGVPAQAEVEGPATGPAPAGSDSGSSTAGGPASGSTDTDGATAGSTR